MSGASTPLQDEVPNGPLTVSLQDISDGIVVDASQLNLMLSLGEKAGDQVISKEEQEQEASDREDEGEFSEENTGESSEELGGVSTTEEEEHSESESGIEGVRLAETMRVTPLDQGPDAKSFVMNAVPVIVGRVVTITREENKAEREMSAI